MTVPTFAGAYTPPDVYVADTTSPIVTATGVPAQTLTLIGPALGYRSASQSFLIYAATAQQLTFGGVFTTAVTGPPAIGAPVVTLPGGQVLIPGTDYSLTVTPDPSGAASLAIATVNRVATSTNVTEGQQVTIAYNYADVTYYQPQIFTDFQSVLNAYGAPLLSSAPAVPNASQVANPLSYGVQVAFANGANTVIGLALNPADGTLEEQFLSAYSKIATMYAATIIVPVFTDDLMVTSGSVAQFAQQLAEDLDVACQSASASGFTRIGFFGLPRNYGESDLPVGTFAQAVGDKRLVLVYPEIVQVFNGLTNQVFSASCCYLAVALGAVLSSLPVDWGLTRQQVNGFVGLTPSEAQAMTPSFMNALAASGVCIVTQGRSGALVCRHGLTTDMSALNNREISMVRQADALLTSLQAGIENANLIGAPLTAEMPATVQAVVTSILEQDITAGIIQSYTSVSVIQQSLPGGDPTIINFSFSYAPAVPLNYITGTFSIDLTTGQVTDQSAQNAAAA